MRVETMYHFARALEGPPACSAAGLYGLSVQHVLNGFIPTARFLAAGRRATEARVPEGAIERCVAQWMRTSVNPLSQVLRNLPSRSTGIWVLNEFDRNAGLNTRNMVLPASDAAGVPWVGPIRVPQLPGGEPPACAIAASFAYRMLGDLVLRNERNHPPRRFTRLSDQARIIGAERTATAQAVQVLECEPLLSAEALAAALGCPLRTLQRQLWQEGISAAAVRAAVRLLRATEQVLWSELSLGQIAIDAGFSDLAHMGRAFRTSCAVAPGVLRRMARHGLPQQPNDRCGAFNPFAIGDGIPRCPPLPTPVSAPPP